jgi:hypothetical protein
LLCVGSYLVVLFRFDLGRWYKMNHGTTIEEQGNETVIKSCKIFTGVKLKLVEYFGFHISVDINRGGK